LISEGGKPLKVVHIDSGKSWRGGQRQVYLLAKGLRDRGHEPLVIAPPGSPLLEKARTAGLAATAVSTRAEWDVLAAKRIRSRLRAWRPDIVHAHDARSHTIAILALGTNNRIPLLVTRRVAFAPRLARVKYGKRVTQFIAISNAVKRAMMLVGVPSEKIQVVYSGVAEPRIATRRDWRAELGWPADTIVCGVVGAMTGEKGIELLRGIIDRLPPVVASKCGIVFLGAEDNSQLPASKVRVHWAGFVDEIADAMAGLDILWHPATSEGLGTSVLDALALGVVPVAFATGGLSETIEPGVSGFLVKPGNLEDFAQAIASLVQDAELRATLGAAGRNRARAFSDVAMIENNIAVYYRVLEGGIL
jgi:glycosyltransferase involved in cell wall biosynthesis